MIKQLMETNTTKLTYRLYKEADKQAIMQLWEEESGWGAITVQQFDDWFLNTPYGNCLIVVAVNDEDKIVGQIINSPSRIIINGREIKSLKVAAPVLHSDFRGMPLGNFDHPAFGMIKAGFELGLREGYQFAFGYPAFGWLAMLRSFPKFLPNPTEAISIDCFSISLEDAATFKHSGIMHKISVNTGFTDEYNTLFEEAVKEMPMKCTVKREPAWLQYVLANHLVLEVRSTDNILKSYAAINKKSGLIIDIFAKNKDTLAATYRSVIYALHQHNKDGIKVNFNKLKGMLSEVAATSIKDTGYVKENYHFAYGGYLLDTSIPFEELMSSQWYMTPIS